MGLFRIDIHFVIKIADFGLSENVYVKNYFRQGETDSCVKLPVKWMAPESLNDGVFSEKTDVVIDDCCFAHVVCMIEANQCTPTYCV